MEEDGQTIVIGAGIGGLASALMLALRGERVTVIDKAAQAGGKIRQLPVDGAMIDAGPTVFTMRSVFDALFESAGTRLDAHLNVQKSQLIARHAWDEDQRLDLFADFEQSCDAIGDFAGADAVGGFRLFSREARRIHDALDAPFMQASKTGPLTLGWRMGWRGLPDWLTLRAYTSLWRALGSYFADPRLRQLFGRYTTYCGSSPFLTPATLMLIADVEAQGVWAIDGGMSALAAALERLARAHGVSFRYGQSVERIAVTSRHVTGVTLMGGEHLPAQHVIFNGDPAALSSGLLGEGVRRTVRPVPPSARSLSALVWLAKARTSGFPLTHHNVFFSADYQAEFRDIAAGRPPAAPTAYVCALDRGVGGTPAGEERLQVIVNAPANGDTHSYPAEEKKQCTRIMLARLNACGLTLEDPLPHQLVTPSDFAGTFPGMGGALYGRASHGWAASFLRPGSRTAIRGLYCAGGATHPGAGVPMAALSGIQASRALLADRISTRRWSRAAIAGGISTPSAATVPMA
jgi:1-hydroxycarotenoid 3,4-desaturase